MNCTRCASTGFLNIHQFTEATGKDFFELEDAQDVVLKQIKNNENHDIQVCDCCGDGENWYGAPGEHYNSEDISGPDGPYAYNGGHCECH